MRLLGSFCFLRAIHSQSEGKHILALPVVQPGSAEGGFTLEMDLMIRTSFGEILSSLLQKKRNGILLFIH